MKILAVIMVLSLTFALLLCYCALRTAEKISKRTQAQIESIEKSIPPMNSC